LSGINYSIRSACFLELGANAPSFYALFLGCNGGELVRSH
jgi:hypothetical protein